MGHSFANLPARPLSNLPAQATVLSLFQKISSRVCRVVSFSGYSSFNGVNQPVIILTIASAFGLWIFIIYTKRI